MWLHNENVYLSLYFHELGNKNGNKGFKSSYSRQSQKPNRPSRKNKEKIKKKNKKIKKKNKEMASNRPSRGKQ